MSATSAKPLFRAMKAKPKADARQVAMFSSLPEQEPPKKPDVRRPDDFYPTGGPEAVSALIGRDGEKIAALGGMVWEPCVGAGHLSDVIEDHGFTVRGGDLVDRGWHGMLCLGSFYESREAAAPAIITNPPYSEINARDGHARWLRHTLSLSGWRYLALLLSWDWPAAFQNGHATLLDEHPFSYCYLMRWKLDFTGEGAPPQRNAWFVWDRDDPRSTSGRDGLAEPSFRFLNKPRVDGARQEALPI